jgi:hypothetical protein
MPKLRPIDDHPPPNARDFFCEFNGAHCRNPECKIGVCVEQREYARAVAEAVCANSDTKRPVSTEDCRQAIKHLMRIGILVPVENGLYDLNPAFVKMDEDGCGGEIAWEHADWSKMPRRLTQEEFAAAYETYLHLRKHSDDIATDFDENGEAIALWEWDGEE